MRLRLFIARGLRPVSGGLLVVVAAAVGVVAHSPCARGDIFHLTSGGRIEGDLLEKGDASYRIRTALGTITLAVDAVERIEAAPTPFREYDERLAQVADTADAQIALAEWCEQQGLSRERLIHLRRAMEIDPDDAKARGALGYVRVGEMWVNGRTAERRQTDAAAPDEQVEDPERLAAAIQGTWRRRIGAIRSSLLESSLQRQVEKGRSRILEIEDPLAIIPLVQVLGEGNVACREVLVDMLCRFPDDVATVNLAALALADPSEAIRRRAIGELVRRADSRVTALFRKALESGDEVLIRRGAEGLAALSASEAISDLICVLKDRQVKMVEVPVPRYFAGLGGSFERRVVYIGSTPVEISPVAGLVNPASSVYLQRRMMNVTVYRTEVREALCKITGRDFGFDMDAWAQWYQENRS